MKSKTKILIIIPRYNITNDINYNYLFPLGLSYISAVLKSTGYHVDCLNLNHCEGYVENIIDKSLCKQKYDYVCTGNVSLGYAITEKIINAVRAHESHPKIVLGGIIITSEPELIFKSLNPDFAVIGEGEETILELLEYLEHGGNLEEVKGVGYLDKYGNIIFTKQRETIKDLDALPMPDFEGFGFGDKLDHQHSNDYYFNNLFDLPRTYSLLGSRGCPFQCTFCYHYNRYVARTIDGIMEELNIMVRRYKINNICIYDECFSINKERLYEYCRRIKLLREQLPWDLKWTCQMTVKSVDKESLRIMKEAGCNSISYGFESYSPIVLKSMRKPITPQLIDREFRETLDVGIAIQANFIFGDIAETPETAKQTLDYWKKNCKGQVNLDFIQPYPGSELYNHCLKKGIIKDKLDFIKNNMGGFYFNMTDKMTDEEFKQLKNDISKAQSEYRESVRPISIKKEGKNIYSIEVKCPYCKKVNMYKNCFINNKLIFEFNLVCRSCPMRFDVMSPIQKIIYAKLSKTKDILLFYIKLRDYIRKKGGLNPKKWTSSIITLKNK